MKLVRATMILALSVFVLAGCDDDPAGVEIADLAGDWTATQFTYAEVGGAGLTVDAIALGGTVTLDVAETGAFTGTLSIPGLTVNPTTGETITVPIGGTISIENPDEVFLDFDAATEQLGLFDDFLASFTLTDNVFTFERDDTTFDFPDALELGAGLDARGPVPVTLTASFQR